MATDWNMTNWNMVVSTLLPQNILVGIAYVETESTMGRSNPQKVGVYVGYTVEEIQEMCWKLSPERRAKWEAEIRALYSDQDYAEYRIRTAKVYHSYEEWRSDFHWLVIYRTADNSEIPQEPIKNASLSNAVDQT